jgi:predicted nucleic-acid-binding Zn-ribbon protein
MKNTRICPKCQSTDLLRFDGNVGAYGSGNNLMVGSTLFSAVKVHRYVCTRCGFTEEWIDREDLEKIKSSKKASRC